MGILFKLSVPRNLTPPKDFPFVKRVIEHEGEYKPTFLDTPGTLKAYKWYLKHRNYIPVDTIVKKSKNYGKF